jgi:hypothetical protein
MGDIFRARLRDVQRGSSRFVSVEAHGAPCTLAREGTRHHLMERRCPGFARHARAIG